MHILHLYVVGSNPGLHLSIGIYERKWIWHLRYFFGDSESVWGKVLMLPMKLCRATNFLIDYIFYHFLRILLRRYGLLKIVLQLYINYTEIKTKQE